MIKCALNIELLNDNILFYYAHYTLEVFFLTFVKFANVFLYSVKIVRFFFLFFVNLADIFLYSVKIAFNNMKL